MQHANVSTLQHASVSTLQHAGVSRLQHAGVSTFQHAGVSTLRNTTVWLSKEIRTSQISKAVKTKSLVETAIFCFVLSDCYDTIQQDHLPHQTFEEKTSCKTQTGSKLHSHSRRPPAEATFHTEKKQSTCWCIS